MSCSDLIGASKKKALDYPVKPDNDDHRNRVYYEYEKTMGRTVQGKNLNDC